MYCIIQTALKLPFHLCQRSFPRLVRSPNSESEIHGFCDASIEAMVPVSTSFATADLNYFAQSQGWPPWKHSLCQSWNCVGRNSCLGSSQKWLGRVHLRERFTAGATLLLRFHGSETNRSSCHSRANWVSGVAICSNFFKSSWHSLPRCFSCWAQRVSSLGSWTKILLWPQSWLADPNHF